MILIHAVKGAGAAQQWYYLPIGEDARSTSAASDFAQVNTLSELIYIY